MTHHRRDHAKWFARRLRLAIGASGMTNTELAKRMGLDKSRVSHWLGGERLPHFNNLLKMAIILDVSLNWLVGLED